MYLDDQPRAQAHLDYYLQGSGATLPVPLDKLIAEDEGVRKKLYLAVLNAGIDGNQRGTVPIAQSDYKIQDWRNALGSININWRSGPPMAPGKVRVGFRNEYRWHPTADRVSQCVHQAADRLKAEGAKDYFMEGWTVIEPSVKEWSSAVK
jgi:hypothetical protein